MDAARGVRARRPRRLGLSAPLSLSLLALAGLCSACVGTHKLTNPTLSIHTAQGDELGVSTDYGIVFLGHTAQSGNIEITAWYGDGPDIEPAVIEPIGRGLFTAETEIRLPQVPLCFDEPAPGTELLVVGQNAGGPWEATVTVESNPRVLGIFTTIPRELENAPDQYGAGVYVLDDGDTHKKRLVGLVSGKMQIPTERGARWYLTVVGPTDLWRLVVHRRDLLQKKRWVYREDIL